MRAMGGRPVLLQRYPERRRRHVVLPEAGARRARPTGCRRRPCRRRTARVATRWWPPTSRTCVWAVNLGCLGFHVWPYLAADLEHADELRIDLDPSPGRRRSPMVREAAAEVAAAARRAGVAGFPKTTGSAGIHIYVRLAARAGLATRCARRRWRWRRELERRRPDLHHRRVVEGGARRRASSSTSTRTRPHKTVFGAWSRAGPAGRAGVDAVRVGRAATTIEPDELTIATVPAPRGRAGRPVGGDGRPRPSRSSRCSSCIGARHGGRADGRAVAARLPEEPNEPPRVAPSRARSE